MYAFYVCVYRVHVVYIVYMHVCVGTYMCEWYVHVCVLYMNTRGLYKLCVCMYEGCI